MSFVGISDRKSCQNIDEQIDEISYNAAGFTWSPNLNAKIVIRINCLSTDFSPQKGVRVSCISKAILDCLERVLHELTEMYNQLIIIF